MFHKNVIFRLFWAFSMLLLVASCVTPKQVAYLQDMNAESQIGLENKFEAVISPYDELIINVTCFNSELAKPFNWDYQMMGPNGNNQNMFTYLVDVNGNIQFPVLGEIKVAGLTRLQLQDYIVGLLKNGNYMDDPFVRVRFYNFKVFFIGADGGKAITISNERCTFLEALAMSGDLDVFTSRERIAVLREVDGKMMMRYLDPRDSKVFNDPFFMLKQNDFIITEPRPYKYVVENINNLAPWVTLVTGAASFVAAFLALTTVASR